MAQQARGCTDDAEDPSSVPCTDISGSSARGRGTTPVSLSTFFFKTLFFTSPSWWVCFPSAVGLWFFHTAIETGAFFDFSVGSILENVLDALGKNAYSAVLG